MIQLASIQDAIYELKSGNMLIVLDSPDRENQADIICPAQTITPEKINFVLQKCRGMICVPITQSRADQLSLPLMVDPLNNTESTSVNFTISVDAKGVSSFGISASDRALTIQLIADPNSKSTDLVMPGHVFPLISRSGGILERPGHTEATITMLLLAGFIGAGVLSEILNDKGEVANHYQLQQFSIENRIKVINIKDLVKYMKNISKIKYI